MNLRFGFLVPIDIIAHFQPYIPRHVSDNGVIPALSHLVQIYWAFMWQSSVDCLLPYIIKQEARFYPVFITLQVCGISPALRESRYRFIHLCYNRYTPGTARQRPSANVPSALPFKWFLGNCIIRTFHDYITTTNDSPWVSPLRGIEPLSSICQKTYLRTYIVLLLVIMVEAVNHRH